MNQNVVSPEYRVFTTQFVNTLYLQETTAVDVKEASENNLRAGYCHIDSRFRVVPARRCCAGCDGDKRRNAAEQALFRCSYRTRWELLLLRAQPAQARTGPAE
jgi:hypothetical protein